MKIYSSINYIYFLHGIQPYFCISYTQFSFSQESCFHFRERKQGFWIEIVPQRFIDSKIKQNKITVISFSLIVLVMMRSLFSEALPVEVSSLPLKLETSKLHSFTDNGAEHFPWPQQRADNFPYQPIAMKLLYTHHTGRECSCSRSIRISSLNPVVNLSMCAQQNMKTHLRKTEHSVESLRGLTFNLKYLPNELRKRIFTIETQNGRLKD